MDDNPLIIQGKKACSSCRSFKPLDAFHRSENHRGGYYPTCKECRATRGYLHRHGLVVIAAGQEGMT